MYLSFSSFSSIANPRDFGSKQCNPLVNLPLFGDMLLEHLNPIALSIFGWVGMAYWYPKTNLNNEGGMYSFYILE